MPDPSLHFLEQTQFLHHHFTCFTLQSSLIPSQELRTRPNNVCGGSTTGYAPQLEALLALRVRAAELMASLHSANTPFLAELFTGCALQVGVRWCDCELMKHHYSNTLIHAEL